MLEMNFVSKDGRTFKEGQKVKGYVNLQNGKMAIQGTDGKVIGYADSVTLTNVEFKVSQSKLKWIKEKGRRTVCAFVVGNITTDCSRVPTGKRISYNPMKQDTFYNVDTGEEVTERFDYVVLTKKMVWAD